MSDDDMERISKLYGCKDRVTSYMIPASIEIKYADMSDPKDEIKQLLESKEAPVGMDCS